MTHIKVIPSPCFVKVLDELSSLPDAPSIIKEYSRRSSIGLTSNDVRWCHQKVKEHGLPHHIHQLLTESRIILPKYEAPPRSPELEARIERLKAEQANREYRQMTKNVVVDQFEAVSLKGFGTDVKELNLQLREMNRQLVTGTQYLVSIIGTFFAVFIGLSYALNEFGTRVLLATFCAVIVGIAEMYFIIRQDVEEEEKIKKKVS